MAKGWRVKAGRRLGISGKNELRSAKKLRKYVEQYEKAVEEIKIWEKRHKLVI